MTEPENSNKGWKSRVRRVANVVGLLLLIAVVLPFVIYAVPQIVGASQSYVVLSGSMEPVMSPGDAIIIESVDPAQIKEGDIITYGGGGGSTPTTHRVIDVSEQDGSLTFETKGDANENADSARVTPGDIQGKVMSVGGYPVVIPFMGHVIQFAGTQTGFFLLFAVPLVLFVLNEIWNIVTSSLTDSGTETDESSVTDDTSPDVTDDRPADTEEDGDSDQSGDATTQTATEEKASGGITFTAPELQLGLLILGAFLVYSVWVAYQTTETWAFGVAGGVGSTFLLLGGLYLVGSSSDASSTTDAPSSAANEDENCAGEPPEVDISREMDIVSEDTQPPEGRRLADWPGVDPSQVEFTRAAGQPDKNVATPPDPARAGRDSMEDESDD